jgi:hypothetical protein
LLGVNLVYAAFHQSGSAETFLAGVCDAISIEHIEIDVIELSGPHFEKEDARLWCLGALRRSMAHAITFGPSAVAVEPSVLLRKRPLVVERGRFESAHSFETEMLSAGDKQLRAEGAQSREPSAVLEMTIRHASGAVEEDDSLILKRVERLMAMGAVIVSDFSLYYPLVHYLRRYTAEPVRFVVGITAIAQMLHEGHYNQLPGSILEGLGRFLATNVKVYVSSMPADTFHQTLGDAYASHAPKIGVVSLDNFHPPPPQDHLFNYLRAAGWMVPLSVQKDGDAT